MFEYIVPPLRFKPNCGPNWNLYSTCHCDSKNYFVGSTAPLYPNCAVSLKGIQIKQGQILKLFLSTTECPLNLPEPMSCLFITQTINPPPPTVFGQRATGI